MNKKIFCNEKWTVEVVSCKNEAMNRAAMTTVKYT